MIWSKEETMSRQEIEEIQLARLKETVKLKSLKLVVTILYLFLINKDFCANIVIELLLPLLI